MDKEAASHKSTNDRRLILEPVSNALMLLVLCSLKEKKRGSNPNFCPVCSDQKPDEQTKQKPGYSLSIPQLGLVARTVTPDEPITRTETL